jgi:hypothetical protein
MRAALLVIALLLAGTGCSDEQSPPATDDDVPSLTPTSETDHTGKPRAPTSPTTPPGVPRREAKAARRTFDTWLGAFVGGDPDRACPLQTPRFTHQQVRRLATRDRIRPGATCGDLVTLVGLLFETFRLEVGDGAVSRAPSPPDRVAFKVRFKGLPVLGYSLVDTRRGWRVDQDLTAS